MTGNFTTATANDSFIPGPASSLVVTPSCFLVSNPALDCSNAQPGEEVEYIIEAKSVGESNYPKVQVTFPADKLTLTDDGGGSTKEGKVSGVFFGSARHCCCFCGVGLAN